MNIYHLIRPLLMAMDAERAHHTVLAGLKAGFAPRAEVNDTLLACSLFGKSFSNPLGLAAGFDKNAEVLDPCFNMGFGFVEAGTVTPRPQAGNPRPRIFRDIPNQSVINRMGFPGLGLDVFEKNFCRFKEKNPARIVGANIGINKDAADAPAEYAVALKRLSPIADYIAINISSPNTPGLRGLQNKDELNALLGHLVRERGLLPVQPPLLVKVAPDLAPEQKEDIASLVLAHHIDGLIVSNTTISRPALLDQKLIAEKGGLSGRLLTDLSTRTIADFYKLTDKKLPIIGVGGISSAEDAYAKIRAGASLVQIYTALVFQGPAIIPRILKGLVEHLRKDGFSSLSQAVGSGQN